MAVTVHQVVFPLETEDHAGTINIHALNRRCLARHMLHVVDHNIFFADHNCTSLFEKLKINPMSAKFPVHQEAAVAQLLTS